jgi:hypothetical protein
MRILLIVVLVLIAQLLFGIFWGKFIKVGRRNINIVDDKDNRNILEDYKPNTACGYLKEVDDSDYS